MDGIFDVNNLSGADAPFMFAPMETGFGQVGPNPDGTYDVPLSAQPYNFGSNQAGNPSLTDNAALDFLKFGVAALAGSYNNRQMLDYKRYEATNGGVYRQGVAAPGYQAAPVQGINPLLLVAGGVVALILLKRG